MSPRELLELTRWGRGVGSVFDLAGTKEPDLTAALGFVLARSTGLRGSLLARLGVDGSDRVLVRMETADDKGRTDLELETPSALFVIEAKRGWNLPTGSQLRQYAGRVRTGRGGCLVTLSECSPEWAAEALPTAVDGVQVRHLPWRFVLEDVTSLTRGATGKERVWLEELRVYPERAVRVTDPSSMWTYCVAVSDGRCGPLTFKEYVQKEHVYFHPHAGSWPKRAPTLLGFRWNKAVREVRRVKEAEVVADLRSRWSTIPAEEGGMPHVLYSLGPPIKLELPLGRDYRAIRLWVLLDKLLTCSTLVEACRESATIPRS